MIYLVCFTGLVVLDVFDCWLLTVGFWICFWFACVWVCLYWLVWVAFVRLFLFFACVFIFGVYLLLLIVGFALWLLILELGWVWVYLFNMIL